MSLPAVHEGLFTIEPPALVGGKCARCGALRFPTREVCPACQHTTMDPVALSTKGTIYTFTILHSSPPGYLGETPYAYGVVELPEGLRVTTTIIAPDLRDLGIGNAVAFELIELGPQDGRVISYAYRQTGGAA